MYRKFCTAILVGIFTVNLDDGWMDGTDDGCTDRWTEFQVESCIAATTSPLISMMVVVV